MNRAIFYRNGILQKKYRHSPWTRDRPASRAVHDQPPTRYHRRL